MPIILNARATALLNISLRNMSQSKHIVKLASLARCLFSAPKTGTLIESDISDEEKVWMLQRMIQLIRDDIYTLLISISQNYTEADRKEQQRYIDVLLRSATTWRKIINRQVLSARRHEHQFESQDGYPDRMATLRTKCEK